jgi:hypothetical protein
MTTAATFIKNDIRNMPVGKSFYPSVQGFLSKEGYLPGSLSSFLKTVASENVLSHQIGLAMQLHHIFGSRFLIDTHGVLFIIL